MILSPTILLIAASTLVVTVLTIKLVVDYRAWLNRKPVNHKKEWVLVVLGCVPSIVLFTLASEFIWYLAAAISSGMCAWFIWTFFDGIYNMLRRYGFFFTGSDDADDAASDNFLQALPLSMHILIKLLPLITLVYIYIKSL